MKSASTTANFGEKVKEVRGVKVLAHRVDNLERAQMRMLVDQLRDKLGSAWSCWDRLRREMFR